MQKLKIEQDFAEKARLVQLELEKEREKAKSEKEKFETEKDKIETEKAKIETEKAKLEHERKKLEQLRIEIREREERNATPVNIINSNSDDSNDKSLNSDKPLCTDKDLNNTSSSSVSTASKPATASHDPVANSASSTVLSVSKNELASSELHESIHSSQDTPSLTNSELLEREKQLLLQQERLDAMQAQLNGKLSSNHLILDSNTSEVLQFVSEREKNEQQKLLLEKAKFSAESKER